MCWGQEPGSRVRSGVASKSPYAGNHTIKICWSKPSYLMACSHMLHLGAKKPSLKPRRSLPAGHYLPASQVRNILQNNHVPHTKRLKSSKDHGHMSPNSKQPTLRTFILHWHQPTTHPSRRSHRSSIIQSINRLMVHTWTNGSHGSGSGMTRTSFLVVLWAIVTVLASALRMPSFGVNQCCSGEDFSQ